VLLRALVGLQGWAVLALVPWWLARWWRSPAFAVLNGQFLAIRADVYDRAGGFEAVRASLAEDAALGRRLVALGYRIAFLDGAGVLGCRPYATVREAWEANVRNLAGALLGCAALAAGGAAALLALYVLPVILLLLGAGPGWPWPHAVALALGLVPRRLADRRSGHGGAVTLLHPLAVAALAAMMLESWRRVRVGATVEWRGRRYRATARAG
jgi:cellulose synthase/poly-beta-1,6-N-acetylglucosamine synthase-like glycosyltransferase